MNFYIRILFLVFFLFGPLSSVWAQMAWAPYERQVWIRPGVSHSEYDRAFLGGSKARYDDNIRITIVSFALEYGITDRLTFDTTVAFGRLGRHQVFNRYAGILSSPEVPDKFGFLDTRVGLRYKILDEFDSKYRWMPTISIRLGGIKKGDYDRNPQSLGDGASGGEINIYLAKDFGVWNMGALAELGYRKRENPVPDDVLYYGALYKKIFNSIYLIGGARGQIGQGGYAYADPRQEPPLN